MTPPASRVYKCLGFGVFVKRNGEIKFPRNVPYWKPLMRLQVIKKDIKLYKNKTRKAMSESVPGLEGGIRASPIPIISSHLGVQDEGGEEAPYKYPGISLHVFFFDGFVNMPLSLRR